MTQQRAPAVIVRMPQTCGSLACVERAEEYGYYAADYHGRQKEKRRREIEQKKIAFAVAVLIIAALLAALMPRGGALALDQDNRKGAGNMDNALICLCREVDRNTGDIATYALNGEVTDRLIFMLSIRSRANPELQYFATLRANFDTKEEMILQQLKRKQITERLLEALNVAKI